MIKILATAIIAFLLAFIAAKTFYTEKGASIQVNPGDHSQRIAALETRLENEIDERIRFQQQFEEEKQKRLELVGRFDQLAFTNNQNPDSAASENQPPRLNRSSFGLPAESEQIAALVEAGFDEALAKRVVSLETEMYQAIVRARFGGTAANPRDLVIETQKTLRQELGNEQYELYLESTGRPTSVPVAAINEASAGQIAGLEVGDEIFSYDGERVFSLLDLQEITQSGTPGQTVIIEVMREDSSLSFAIPRGQIGISTGRTGFGFGRGRSQRQ